MQHTDLNGVGADVIQHRPDLAGDEIHRHRVYARDAYRIFIHDGYDGRHPVTTAGREGFQVGLNACSAARIASGDRQDPLIVFFHN